ncbi:MAG TPA: GDSL-type esterase/lipase family protein, partial [Polyangiaceae bacterium]
VNIAGGGAQSIGGAVVLGGAGGKGGANATGGNTANLPAVTVYIAGDSIVSTYTDTAATNDQAGWGQMLPPLFNSKVTFVNRAAGGRTAYWFYLEGALQKILSTLKAGDYLLIEFGTNDQNTTATFEVDGTTYPRLAEPALFKTQLKQYYLDPVKAKGATPVLVTPPPRNSAYCNGGNGLSAYATAMLELGAAENVYVIDNNAKTYAYVKAICPKPTTAADEKFFFGKSDGTIDGTHFQEKGARTMAGFIADGVRASGLTLAGYLL